MRITLAIMAAASALVLASCKAETTPSADQTNKAPADQKEVVCNVAKSWISADLGVVKSQIAVSLQEAVRKAERSTPESSRSSEFQAVIDAAKTLETNADAPRTIEKYC